MIKEIYKKDKNKKLALKQAKMKTKIIHLFLHRNLTNSNRSSNKKTTKRIRKKLIKIKNNQKIKFGTKKGKTLPNFFKLLN